MIGRKVNIYYHLKDVLKFTLSKAMNSRCMISSSRSKGEITIKFKHSIIFANMIYYPRRKGILKTTFQHFFQPFHILPKLTYNREKMTVLTNKLQHVLFLCNWSLLVLGRLKVLASREGIDV